MTNQMKQTTASNAFIALQQGKLIEIHHKSEKPLTYTNIHQYKMMTDVDGVKKLYARVYGYRGDYKIWDKWHVNMFKSVEELGFSVDEWIDGTEASKMNEYYICPECTLTFQEAMHEVAKTKHDGFIMSENGTVIEVHAMSSGLVRLYTDPAGHAKYDEFYLEYVDLMAKWRVM